MKERSSILGGFEPVFVRNFCGKIQDGRIIVAMGGQGHVTSFEVSDWFLSFHCHGNQDGGQRSKNNIFSNYFKMMELQLVVICGQGHVTSFNISN